MNDIKLLFSQVTDLIFNEVSNKLDENANMVDEKLNEMYTNVRLLEGKIGDILKDVSELKDEFSNYQRVSIVSNLNNQIRTKDRELTQLKKQLEKSTENVVKVTYPPVEIPVDTTEDDADNATTTEPESNATEEIVTTVSERTEDGEDDEGEEDDEDDEVVEVVEEGEDDEGEDNEGEVEEVVEEGEEDEEVVEEGEGEDDEVEEVVEEVGEEGVEEEEEEGVSLIEKMLKDPKTGKRRKFLITEDSDKDIYDIDADGDPSEEPIGKLTGKNNRPTWF